MLAQIQSLNPGPQLSLFKLVSDPRGEPATTATIQRTAASCATPAASSLRLQPSPAPSHWQTFTRRGPGREQSPPGLAYSQGPRRGAALPARPARLRGACPFWPPARQRARARTRLSVPGLGSWDGEIARQPGGPESRPGGGDFFRLHPAISPRLPCYTPPSGWSCLLPRSPSDNLIPLVTISQAGLLATPIVQIEALPLRKVK